MVYVSIRTDGLFFFYTDISQALKYSIKKFETWYEKTKDSEKVRTVVTHGKVSLKHFVYDERGYGYFINFENSNTAPPHFDLLPFLVKAARTYPVQCDDCVDWLYNYFRYFPVKRRRIIAHAKLSGIPWISFGISEEVIPMAGAIVQSLIMSRNCSGNFELLKNIEYMVMRIEEIEQKKKAAAEAAKEEQSPPS